MEIIFNNGSYFKNNKLKLNFAYFFLIKYVR